MLTILDEINKALSYLNINIKYLNRAYTLITIIPIFLIIKMLFNANTTSITFWSYTLGLIVILYFWILNLMYYFFGKNTKLDITQLLAKRLPDEMFNSDGTATNNDTTFIPDTEILEIKYVKGHEVKLRKNIENLITEHKLLINDYEVNGGYLIPKNTLHPYYYIEYNEFAKDYNVKIGQDLDNMQTIGIVDTNGQRIETLGLYITGGPFRHNDISYKQVYGLRLVVKKRTS